MNKKTCNRLAVKGLLFLLVALLSSCASSKRLRYFQDMPQVVNGTEFEMTKFEETLIKPDDILNIRVNTIDQEASEAINSGNSFSPGNSLGVSVGGMGANNQMVTGYLVAQDGNVEIPILGSIELAGSTLLEAKQKIKAKAEEYFKDATVSIRFSNFRLSVLGEVNRPGTFIIPNQRVSVLDAIAFSGDLSVYGRRSNVMVIRKDDEGKGVAVKIDLTSKDAFTSPYFYLRQNDIVYVEPAGAKWLNTDNSVIRYASLLLSLVSLGVVIYR
ncbi:polysaccharide biosynthesis/export family protein [Olivibacter sp. SDN3]|uniref:polysaccharide biosynthesis/export family protein n=1 Tax=Olivibacter sp. SDN3 TaxID=2764720 RepID=UPI001651A38B|nr:polysaccharide biosynthesis/export family protein [Olivibacter sp. SDN3]QNL52044.1 polysaccharide biosynthesis/export family protein [Olivibacter sp. SDN3]